MNLEELNALLSKPIKLSGLVAFNNAYSWIAYVNTPRVIGGVGSIQKTSVFADAMDFTITYGGETKAYRKYTDFAGDFQGELIELDPKTFLPLKKENTMTEPLTDNCSFCGHQIEGDVALAKKFFEAIAEHEWDRISTKAVESIVERNAVTALLVSKKDNFDTGEVEDSYYSGEYPQGSSFEAHLVFRIGESFFKKAGHGDSYGSVEWEHGSVTKVNPTTRTITEYR